MTRARAEALFVPLKAEFFRAFECGDKTRELRAYGPRWNETACRIGRPVILSLGYSRGRRLHGRVIGFTRAIAGDDSPIYPAGTELAAIEITLEDPAAETENARSR